MIVTQPTPQFVRGAAELEQTSRGVRPHRLPAHVRAQFPDPQLLLVESQPSGVRVMSDTTAERVEVELLPTRSVYTGIDRPRGRVDVYVDGEKFASDELTGGDAVEVDLQTGAMSLREGPSHTTTIEGLAAGETKRVEFWLPHNESVELIELRSDAPLEPVTVSDRVWLHHGSSISHGSNATSPSDIWPAVAARRGGVELVNLGLGGSAMVDPFLARVMRDTRADLISVKLGINVVNADAMRVRAFVPAVNGFLDTIRDGHPETPIVLISPIFCGIHEHTAGPGAFDPASFATGKVKFIATGTPGDESQGRLTLSVIRRELAALAGRRASDPNLFFLDGTELYGEADAQRLPLPDDLHPGPEAHQLMGDRFADYAFAPAGPFSARS
ncbi:GDSL-type esterase/lipase family protein [Pseudoclavibacter sp. RFBA6]|uniref:GDSL-type esterase/lipase family protein n=1 Tax=Pseudoclavibacter sp. RFBA6 TaxID=2080573 RepID=UPI000CE79619|nr:GDSL-type esterase/lipase family protein [Pseudoclavibacter sp. RFBA6]PPG40082.1 lipase [Pseudoclavibacter sp. RFBA6]